jgi:hypothetical protein
MENTRLHDQVISPEMSRLCTIHQGNTPLKITTISVAATDNDVTLPP